MNVTGWSNVHVETCSLGLIIYKRIGPKKCSYSLNWNFPNSPILLNSILLTKSCVITQSSPNQHPISLVRGRTTYISLLSLPQGGLLPASPCEQMPRLAQTVPDPNTWYVDIPCCSSFSRSNPQIPHHHHLPKQSRFSAHSPSQGFPKRPKQNGGIPSPISWKAG